MELTATNISSKMCNIEDMDRRFKTLLSSVHKFTNDNYFEYASELKAIVTYLFGESTSRSDLLLHQLFQFLGASRKIILNKTKQYNIKAAVKMANIILERKLTAVDEDRIFFETIFALVLYHENCDDVSNMLYFDKNTLLKDYPCFKELVGVDDEEIIKLLFFRNWMKVVLLVIPPHHNKGRLLNIVTRICEGDSIKYITGGGQNAATERRVIIYEQEGNIMKKARPERRIKQNQELETELDSESNPSIASPNDFQSTDDHEIVMEKKIRNRPKRRLSDSFSNVIASSLTNYENKFCFPSDMTTIVFINNGLNSAKSIVYDNNESASSSTGNLTSAQLEHSEHKQNDVTDYQVPENLMFSSFSLIHSASEYNNNYDMNNNRGNDFNNGRDNAIAHKNCRLNGKRKNNNNMSQSWNTNSNSQLSNMVDVTNNWQFDENHEYTIEELELADNFEGYIEDDLQVDYIFDPR